jgi:diacylglycerol kinase (ATP)
MVDHKRIEGYSVRIIANPYAGRDEPFFGPLAAAFGDADVRWNIDVTNNPGEEWGLAQRAVAEGAKMVVAFGGDGTVSAVADALVDTDAILGILPGGTANVFARELGIPADLEGAAKLLAGPHDVRAVDLGRAELSDGTSRTFLLRVSVGMEATIVEDSPRREKERLGEFAYWLSAIRQIPDPPIAHYTITSEHGESIELDGLFAALTNAAALGLGDAVYGPDVRVDDGLLDGVIAPAVVTELIGAAAAVLGGNDTEAVERISGSQLELSADPPQRVTVDGEPVGDTPVRVSVRPGAVRVVVPKR